MQNLLGGGRQMTIFLLENLSYQNSINPLRFPVGFVTTNCDRFFVRLVSITHTEEKVLAHYFGY